MKRYTVLLMLFFGASAQAQNPPLVGNDVLNLINFLGTQGQRSGGPRGGAPQPNPDAAWWTNTDLVARLGLTEEQKVKIERAFQNHRQDLASWSRELERAEAQLARFLEADPIDRAAVIAQISGVVQARGEMEKTNALMTLEMREALTRPQWLQLQSLQAFGAGAAAGRGARQGGQRGLGGAGDAGGLGTGGARGARGQRGQ
jgi:Spy/CpxP family protein refolding chaperone